jgi:beta-aspartyl-dipeptidase (metallo-type)
MPELSVKDLVRAGVTTVVGVLGTDSRTRTVGNLIARARGLCEEGITAYCLTGSYEYPSVSLTGDVADDIVYLPEVLGVKLAIADHRCSNPTSANLTELASKVRIASLLAGKPGLVHMHTGIGKNGLKIVVDTIRESDIPLMHFMPTHIRPDTPYVDEYLNMGGAIDLTSGNTPETAAKYLKYFLERTEPEQITVSSDANGTMPVWNERREIIGFQAARLSLFEFLRVLTEKEGMTLPEALPFVTVHAAKRLKIYPQKGTLQAGSDADLLILGEDGSLESVMAGGNFLMEE